MSPLKFKFNVVHKKSEILVFQYCSKNCNNNNFQSVIIKSLEQRFSTFVVGDPKEQNKMRFGDLYGTKIYNWRPKVSARDPHVK